MCAPMSSIVTVTVNKPAKKQSTRQWLALFGLSEPSYLNITTSVSASHEHAKQSTVM